MYSDSLQIKIVHCKFKSHISDGGRITSYIFDLFQSLYVLKNYATFRPVNALAVFM